MPFSPVEKITGSVGAILKSLECAICLELLQNPVSTGCGHFFCRFCITETLQSNYRSPCPLCKKSFTRRGIQEATQRQAVIKAAKKLSEVCVAAFGLNFFPKENTQKENLNDLPDLKKTVSRPKLQDNVVNSKKRKSDEILLNGELEESEDPIPLHKNELLNQNANKEASSSADEAIPPTNKRYCQAVDDDDYELPCLEDLFERQNMNISSEMKDKAAVENMPLLTAEKETDKQSEEKKLVIRRKTQKGSSKAKDQVIVKNRKNALKNKTNLDDNPEKRSMEITKFLPANKNHSDKSDIFHDINEISKENKKNDGTPSNKSKLSKVEPRSRKKLRKSESCSNSSAEEGDLILKIKEAESHPLVFEKNSVNHVDGNIPSEECYELPEVNIPNIDDVQPQVLMDRANIDVHRKDSKNDEIPDTVISVHTVVSPQMSKSNLASKSPGWSRVRKERKDFKIKKFSRLSVQKNTSACPVDEVSVENKTQETSDDQMKCNEIPDTDPMTEQLNQNSLHINVQPNLHEKDACESTDTLNDNSNKDIDDARENIEEHEPIVQETDVSEANVIKDKVNQMSDQKCLSFNSKQGKNKSISFSLVDKTQETLNKQNCSEIPETFPMLEESNKSSTLQANIHPDLNRQEVLKSIVTFDDNTKSQNLNMVGEDKDVYEPMLVAPDINEVNVIEDNVNQTNYQDNLFSNSKLEKNKSVSLSLSEIESSNLVQGRNLKNQMLQFTDQAPCVGNEGCMLNTEIDFQKNTNLNNVMSLPMETDCPKILNESTPENLKANSICAQVPSSDMYESNIHSLGKRTKQSCEKKDSFCKSPITSLIKKSRCSKISKITKHNNISAHSASLKDDVYYVEHSQQTSQRLDFYDTNLNVPLIPVLPVKIPPYHTEAFTSNALMAGNKSIVPWFNNKEKAASEKTKVVKRTCLTLEEIQDYFTKSTFSGKSETICSLPFLSDNYKLHICVSDDTLNISVLKVVESEMPPADAKMVNFLEKSDTHGKDCSVFVPEKSFKTLSTKFHSRSPTVLPSSDVESESSEPEDNSEVVRPKHNPFPFLSKFFSDSESTPQLNDVPDTSHVTYVQDTLNVNHVSNTSNVNYSPDISRVNYVSDTSHLESISDGLNDKDIPDKSNRRGISSRSCVNNSPVRSEEKDESNFVGTEDCTKTSSSKKMPMKFTHQIEETPNNAETDDNCKEVLEQDPKEMENSDENVINSKASCEKNKKSPTVASENNVEMIDITSQDSMDQDASDSILVNSFPSRKKEQNHCKQKDSDILEDSEKAGTTEEDHFLSNLTDSKHLQTSTSYYARLIEERDALSSDPAMAFANDLVGPLKDIAQKINSASQESNVNKLELSSKLEKVSEISKNSPKPDDVLSYIKENSFSNKNTKQRTSRLSLKKKQPSRFRRIQSNDSDSDSDEPDSTKTSKAVTVKSSKVEDGVKSISPIEKNVTSATFRDQSTLNSLLSDDVNSSEIVKEIEDIDEKIKCVEEQLKMYGHGDLVSKENLSLLKDIRGEECITSEESEDSDDLFSQSIPPTPPETIGNSRDSIFQKPNLNY